MKRGAFHTYPVRFLVFSNTCNHPTNVKSPQIDSLTYRECLQLAKCKQFKNARNPCKLQLNFWMI